MLLITISFICLALAVVLFASKKKENVHGFVEKENHEIDPSTCDSEPAHDDNKEEIPVPVNEDHNQGKNPTFIPDSEKGAPAVVRRRAKSKK